MLCPCKIKLINPKPFAMKKYIIFMLLVIAAAKSIVAQTKRVQQNQQIWTGYFNQSRFSNKWGVWLDVHLRTKEDLASQFSQFIIRPGLTYYINDATKLSTGYAYISHFPAEGHSG